LVIIETDQLQYSKAADSAVSVKVVNQTVHPIFIPQPTFFVALEVRRDAGVWEDLGAWYGTYPDPGEYLPLNPGDSLGIDMPLSWDRVEPGEVYRFIYELYGEPKPEALLPLAFRVSNPFGVVE
jgi:hypothetical protein